MANATSTGEIRPEITSTVHLADGTTQTVSWVREAAVIKRIRRKLAERNHRFVISREATQARTELGLYSVLDADGDVLQRDANLTDLARFLNVLADHETLEPARERGWRYHVCRRVSVEHDGITRVCVEPITKTFTTEKAAWKAAEHIEDRHGLVVVSMDAIEAKALEWEREEQERHQAAMAAIEAAIDANPILRRLRGPEGCPQAWGSAVAFDLQLQKDPAWSEKPIADRVAEVARLLVVNGLVDSAESEVHAHAK